MDNEQGIIKPTNANLSYNQRGVLWVQKEPHYIVELIMEGSIRYAIVYRAQPKTNPPMKAATAKSIETVRFTGTTALSQLANNIFKPKKTQKWIQNPPIFVAPILPNQTNTFTKQVESGFFEREPDRTEVISGEPRLVRGRNTGVFIGLSSIEWSDTIRISKESILKTLRDYQQDSFFDLNGSQGPDNPLSEYYKE